MSASWNPETMTYTLRRGGSARGLSYWSKWVDGDCEKKMVLNEQAEESGFFDNLKMPMQLDGKGAAIGTLGHAFLHAWIQSEHFSPDLVGFEPATHPVLSDEDVWSRATKAIDWFTSRYNRALFRGDQLQPEHELELPELFGCEPITAALDLDFVATAEQALLFGIQFNIDLVPGQRYILDWKFKEATNEQLSSGDYPIEIDLEGMQRVLYMTMAAKTGQPPAGFIHLFILRPRAAQGNHKAFAVMQGPPRDLEMRMLESFLQRASTNRAANWNKANPKRCYDWKGKKCYYLHNGCERF